MPAGAPNTSMRAILLSHPLNYLALQVLHCAVPFAVPFPLQDWAPFDDCIQFETAEFLYTHIQLSAPQIDVLLDLWGATLLEHNAKPPFTNCCSLYNTIDSILLGDVKWQQFKVQYTGDIPVEKGWVIQTPTIPPINSPPWMRQSYEVWYCDVRKVVHQILGNPSYANEINLWPFQEFVTEGDQHQYKDFMSGDWAWDQLDITVEDEAMHGSMFMPIILGSDRMTVSVATGNNEFYPLYLSIGNVQNNVHHAHQNALVLLGFLTIPKSDSLSMILDPLKLAMTSPEVVKFRDGYYHHVIYGLGLYIADYEEQALLACIVQGWCARCQATCRNLDNDALLCCHEFTKALFRETYNSLAILWDEYGIVVDLIPFTNDFPHADIHQLIMPDILHQLIKGCFKDHLVDWVETYLKTWHGTKEAEIATVTPFTGLCHFPQGQGFKQWTGDDSKALMKVYLPVIRGHVPAKIVCTFCAFLEFCYLVHCHVITEQTLKDIKDALACFHCQCEIFRNGEIPVVTTFSLPHQHAAKHYLELIQLFSIPNGLCSSITECKHIKAYNAISQMLLTNQCLDKLAHCHIDFTTSTQADDDEGIPDDLPMNLSGHRKWVWTMEALATEIDMPNLPALLRNFLLYQQNPNDPCEASEIPITDCPHFKGSISVFNSASAQFYAPSNLSGPSGVDPSETRMQAYDITCIFAFFAFRYKGIHYPCTVIHWFDNIGDGPDEDTGMWMVCPSFLPSCSPNFSIIHTDLIYCPAHLIPIYGNQFISCDI
ncbi:hypothetical protein EDD16DRAFT_1689620 [Pisolithus croceorrhizus]|nr:hypothetical protein EDD16DRAFT_1689620 [Pisolithus croceorrhizus]KAI6131366.1 hypothetical protein EV401DRAFT_2054062 [Pisolithus croceorrhizus]KAI6161206.1 hypothetical protein EDD17DRAFT_1777723 [Pisolithus thermaeus]